MQSDVHRIAELVNDTPPAPLHEFLGEYPGHEEQQVLGSNVLESANESPSSECDVKYGGMG